ncbi:hypothetical protein F5I97DRAFT_1801062 [Phlebopus sp. FC_14]|nr:hypothetical protein F5I97DRAFT_1801062 [Phlebopus sp. FC_14]
MNWLANLFAGGNKQNSRRGQAMSNTHEAFSLPTSSPGFAAHPDAFTPEALPTADPLSPSYTYPPQSPLSAYGYVPTSYGPRSRPPSLLPLHNTPYTDALTPPPPYPPLAHTWNRLKLWLAREYPELGDTLNYGILPQDLAQIEMQFGFALPQAVRESYLAVDGQEAESSAGCSEGLFFGLSLLPLEDVLEEWRFWREVDEDPATGANSRLRELMRSVPDGWVRKEYSQRGWIPLVVDKAGNYIGVDLNPGESGSVGQVIVFGRDFDTKIVLWRGDGPGGWAKWLSNFVDELESGEGFELGQNNNDSEGSEDDVGYEAYFFDGNGRGQGDGGGESGSGGLRLTGEYRGWSPLEAWADRSVKKWYEAGVLQDVSSPVEKGKVTRPKTHGCSPLTDPPLQGPEKRGLGVLNLAESAAVVPIPIFADKISEEPTAPANITSRPSVPAISVTKPPAPLPVDLPSASDVVPLPSPPDSQRSSTDDDLEAGRGIGMRPLSSEGGKLSLGQTPVSAPPNATSLTSDIAPADDAELSPAPLDDVTDLLADSAPPLVVPAINPSTMPEIKPSTQDEESASYLGPSLDGVADTTIRLVGGGGLSGSSEILPADGTDEVAHVASAIASSTGPNESPTEESEKHHKNKSSLSSGFKRFSTNIAGAKRRKDSSSSSSIKETP